MVLRIIHKLVYNELYYISIFKDNDLFYQKLVTKFSKKNYLDNLMQFFKFLLF